MCNWCGCQAKTPGYRGKKMRDESARHEATESQVEQIFEYGKVKNSKAPRS